LSSSIASRNSHSTNYWLSNDNCQPIGDLYVSLDVEGPGYLGAQNGFSLQLNAVPPPNNGTNVTWMQYALLVGNYGIDGVIQYWDNAASANCVLFSNNQVGSNCCNDGNCGGVFSDAQVADLDPSNVIPGGSFLAIDLYSSNGNITGALFAGWINWPYGGWFQNYVPIPENLQIPIQAFQFVAVGLDNLDDTTFTHADGYGGGTINYVVHSGNLCVMGANNSCSPRAIYSGFTGETSNMSYGPMDTCCGPVLSQSFLAVAPQGK